MCKCLSVVGRILIGILSVLFAVLVFALLVMGIMVKVQDDAITQLFQIQSYSKFYPQILRFNLLVIGIMILGFALLIIGIMVKVQADAITQLFTPLLDMAKSQAQAATGSSLDLPTDNFNIAELVGGLAIAFIIIGVVMLFLGVFGVAGACCQVKCMLIVYMVIVGLFLVSQIVMVIILSVDRPIITDPPRAELKTTLQTEYSGANGTDVTSLMWNVIMQGLDCCGLDGEADFAAAARWQSLWGPGNPDVTFVRPAACCTSGSFTSTVQTCATDLAATDVNKVGCYDKLWDFILTGTPFIIFVCADIGGFALLTFFSAVILYNIIQKKKIGTMA